MATQRFKPAEIAEALRKSGGIATAAATILKQSHGKCSAETVRIYLRRYPSIQAAVDEAIEATLDIAESKLILALNAGEEWAVRFYLETKGRNRGYSRRSEIVGVPGQPVMVTNGSASAREWLAAQLDEMGSRLRPEPGGTDGAAGPGGTGTPPQETVH